MMGFAHLWYAEAGVGVADAEWNKVKVPDGDGVATFDESYLKGLQRVRRELFGGGLSEADRKRWEKLESLKPGDTFQAKIRGNPQLLTFRHVTDRGYKFVFVADNESGIRYKYPLSVIVV